MKYKLLRYTLLSMLVMFFGGLAFADEVTMKYSGDTTGNMTGENDAATFGLDAEAWSVVGAKGGSSNFPGLNKTGDFRLYYSDQGGSTITVSSLNGATINSIKMTFTSDTYSNVSVTVDDKAVEATDGVHSINSGSFVLGNANTTNVQVRIKEVVIDYTPAGGQSDTRTETTVALGEYQTTGVVGGTIDLPSYTVKAGDTSIDAIVTWTSSDTTVATISDGKINLLKAGTTTIKASFAGNDNYKDSSASYTLTVETAPYTSIAAMLSDITSTRTTATYKFENLLVTYVNGSNTYVSDGTNGFLLYGSNLGLVAGNAYNGTVTGQLYTYNGLPEMAVNASGIAATVVSEGNIISWSAIAPADLQNNINVPVTIKNAVFVSAGSGKNLNFKVGDTDFVVYNQWSIDATTLEAEKTYTLTGVGSVYSKNETTTYQLYLVSFEEKAAEEGYVYRDFAVELNKLLTTDDGENVTFGLKVAEDGTVSRIASDATNANAIVSGKTGNNHGLQNFSATIAVEGSVKITMGTCSWGGDVTIKNAAGETVATFTTKKGEGGTGCYKGNGKDDENIISAKYVGEATTLTISGGAYVNFFAVEKVEATSVEVSYTIDDIECEGNILPAGGTYAAGDEYTIPAQNHTLYMEGYTLTGWSDGTNVYAAGEKFTLPKENITLAPVFTKNEVSLADRTEPVTVKFDFQKNNGAPSVQWQNQDNLVWVAQATVNGKTIDVPTHFSTAPGKFNNTNWGDWCQINEGTTFTVPSCKGAVVSVEAFNELSKLTIDGQSDYTSAKTISYTVASSAETVNVVFGNDGSYYRYIQIVLPVVEQQGGGESYDNAAAKVVWAMSDPANISASDVTPEGIFSTVAVNTGDLTLTGTGTGQATYPDGSTVTFTKLKPAGSTTAVEWALKPATGLTFTPTKISAYIIRFGTDAENGITISAKAGNGEAITLGNFTAPRNNKSQADDKYGSSSNYTNQFVIELTPEQQASLASADGLSVFGTIGVGGSKEGGYAEMTIEGTINGTKANIATYTLNTAVAPEGAGSVNTYPAAEKYEAGTEVTLTATENFGYDFVNWTNAAGEKVSTEAKFKYTVNSNETLTANFKAVETYELALTVDGTNDYMVTVNPAPTVVDGKNMYEAGTAVQLTANQYEGLVTFTNWSDGETSASKLISMTANTQITAMYAQADIIAGWDFYTAGGNGRKADFFAQDNDADALNLVKTEDGSTSGWLDKSTLGGGGYESFKGAAVNWRTGASNGDVGNYHWQTKVNAEAFTDINVQFQMLYNYNAYQTYNVEFSTNGENWTKAGSISMTGAKAVASFNDTLPAAANNQKDLYIRMIADKTSKVDGAASANDGNTLAMFFITGTPKLVNDGKAPVLVSTVPADNATGVSATGKVVLTFDERVKVAANTKAIIGNQELVPIVSGKTVTFEYKGLEYATPYTFTLPANTIGDLTDNMKAEAIMLNFTTMERPAIQKGSYDAVVENVEQLMAAITKAEARSDKNVRFRIFIKNGNYTIPLSSTMKTVNGYEVPECITFINSGKISFIGESRDSVIITNGIEKTATFAGTYGTTSKYDGIGNSDVFQIKGSDYYFQDLTIESGMEDATGRDLAVQDKATRTIYKNTGLRGYQDTWTSNNDNGLYYFEGGYVRGRTDYMCGKGDAFFNGVELRQIAGGYAAVPSKSIKYGYVYKNCVINGEPAVVKYDTGEKRSAKDVDGNYTLGRPWGSGTPIALYIDTKMNVVPSAIGWNEMSGGFPKRFAEYNSMTSTGSVIDLSGRKKIFGDNHANNPVLTAEEALEAGNLHNMFGEWNPTLATEQAPVPANVKLTGNTLTWDNSNYTLLWAVVKNGSVVDFTTEPTFTIDDATAAWAVRAANEMGGLSEAVSANTSTGIESISNAEQMTKASGDIYNMQGIRVNKAQKGLYIINGKKVMVK